MMKTAALGIAFSCFAAAQSAPSFEVVSIKPAPQPTPDSIRSGAGWIGMKIDGARVQIGGYTHQALLSAAFRTPLQQIVAPDFARTGMYFDIQAKLPDAATRDQVPEMLQAMLVERFKLAYHHEMRDYQVSVLSMGKNGMKLPRLPDNTPPSTKSTTVPGGGLRMTVVGKVSALFPVMNSFGGLQMVDETGLDGIYTWTIEQEPPRPGVTYQDMVREAYLNTIEAAGLKLETRKVPRDTIVVDRLEKAPTEN